MTEETVTDSRAEPLPIDGLGVSAAPIDSIPPTPSSRWWHWPAIVAVPMALLAILFALLAQEPDFYVARLDEFEPVQRRELSDVFVTRATNLLMSDLSNAPVWKVEFEEDPINAWLAEDFERNHAQRSLPHGVSKPRISLEGDRLLIGFRFRRGPFSTVIQVGLRAWVPKANLLVVELEEATAGVVPLPTTQMRRLVEAVAHDHKIEVTWKRNGSNLVAVLDFSRPLRDGPLRQVKVGGGSIIVRGVNAHYSRADFGPSAN